jgi:hypothetical protein
VIDESLERHLLPYPLTHFESGQHFHGNAGDHPKTAEPDDSEGKIVTIFFGQSNPFSFAVHKLERGNLRREAWRAASVRGGGGGPDNVNRKQRCSVRNGESLLGDRRAKVRILHACAGIDHQPFAVHRGNGLEVIKREKRPSEAGVGHSAEGVTSSDDLHALSFFDQRLNLGDGTWMEK